MFRSNQWAYLQQKDTETIYSKTFKKHHYTFGAGLGGAQTLDWRISHPNCKTRAMGCY